MSLTGESIHHDVIWFGVQRILAVFPSIGGATWQQNSLFKQMCVAKVVFISNVSICCVMPMFLFLNLKLLRFGIEVAAERNMYEHSAQSFNLSFQSLKAA